MNLSNKYIQSCLNYTGSKYKILPQIFPLFPENVNNFIDLFSGGGVVAINAAEKYNNLFQNNTKIVINDNNSHIIDFFNFLKITDHDILLKNILDTIKKYNLSDTFTHGYEYYGVNSSKGLAEYNKQKYLNLRDDYNKDGLNFEEKNILLYLLIVYGFNNQIRFNSKGSFNLPVGKRDFNLRMRSKLLFFQEVIKRHDFVFENKDFREITNFKKDDFIYCDPPYSLSTATYNENGGWNEQDDLDLFEYLDYADSKGVKFAMSNISFHKGKGNDYLLNWAGKYNLYLIDHNYNNSNYQSKAKESSTVEVLITNY
ncbi:TPA: DNA adenine methylase [Enterococcus faecium]